MILPIVHVASGPESLDEPARTSPRCNAAKSRVAARPTTSSIAGGSRAGTTAVSGCWFLLQETTPAYGPGRFTLSMAATTLPKTTSITTMNVPMP